VLLRLAASATSARPQRRRRRDGGQAAEPRACDGEAQHAAARVRCRASGIRGRGVVVVVVGHEVSFLVM
jgi:hypothetical protein